MEEVIDQIKKSEDRLLDNIKNNDELNKDRYDFLKSEYDKLSKIIDKNTNLIQDIQKEQSTIKKNVNNIVNELKLEMNTLFAKIPGETRELVRGDFVNITQLLSTLIIIIASVVAVVVFVFVDLRLF